MVWGLRLRWICLQFDVHFHANYYKLRDNCTMQDNKDTADISGLLIKLATKLFRMLLWLLAITASIGAVAYLYSAYEEHKELTYMTSDKCSEHDYQTQICETEDGSLYLRRIEMANNRMSVSMLIDDAAWDDYKYSYWAFWFESCEEGLELETNKVDSSGTVFKLSCNTQANYFFTNRPPSRLEIGLTTAVKSGIKLDSDGFTIDHDYNFVDYSSLQRRLVLTNKETKIDREIRRKKEAQDKLAKRLQIQKEAEEALQLAKQLQIKKEAEEALQLAKQLQIKKTCEYRNIRAKEDYNTSLTRAKNLMLSIVEPTMAHRCHSPNPDYPQWCRGYTFKVTNVTDVPIKSIKIGWAKASLCSKTPKNVRNIKTSIKAGGSYTTKMAWTVFGGSTCSRLLDVEFDTTFKPEQC
jgi:hypothetical protein